MTQTVVLLKRFTGKHFSYIAEIQCHQRFYAIKASGRFFFEIVILL
jgi:hypothetical protein